MTDPVEVVNGTEYAPTVTIGVHHPRRSVSWRVASHRRPVILAKAHVRHPRAGEDPSSLIVPQD